MKIWKLQNVLFVAVLIILIIVSFFKFLRLDLTSDKRYSISNQTINLMIASKLPIEITVYLDGDLNPGFLQLKRSTTELLEELSIYTSSPIQVKYINPSLADSPEKREANYAQLALRGLTPTAVYEHDKEGKSIQKVIFPWLEISCNGRKVPVCLLKNIVGNTGDENLNISVENLEFEITDGIRRALNTEIKKIAFIEGHGELTDLETMDISKSLSSYFQIDRGVLGTNPAILKDYEAIIIAKPTQPFSESDKFIVDQYIMNGGNVLWLIDGVRIANENLSTIGISPAMELDLNLNDQLFRYGVRINPIILQDVQCTSVPVNMAALGATPKFEASPWYYAPLLLASPAHAITKNITQVKAYFCSGIDLVGDNKQVKSDVILATSNNTHIVGTPTTIDLSKNVNSNDKNYFNMSYLPVAVALEGHFDSDFTNRMVPKGIVYNQAIRHKSSYSRQIFVADGDIIRNEMQGKNDSTVVPLGFDRYMNQQFGNKDFIQNAVLYITDTDGWMELRNRTIKLRLLNKKIATSEQLFWQLLNVLVPICLLLLFGFVYQVVRRRKYTK